MRKVKVFGLSVILFLTGSSAKVLGQQKEDNFVSIAAARSATPADGQQEPGRPVPAQRNPRYRVEQNDVLNLTFPLSPEFNQVVTVQPDEYINLQGAESIFVGGMTTPEITQALKKAYVGTLHEPIINVDLKEFHKAFFIVSGQVIKPGQYDLRNNMTISQAIAIAGGLSPAAKTQVFLFHRVSPDWVEVKKLSVKNVFNGKDVREDAYLTPGDMIFIPEKFITKFRKYVPYGLGLGLNPATLARML